MVCALSSTRIGGDRTVLVYDYHLAKEAMASADIIDRPKVFDQFSLDERKKGGWFALLIIAL